MEFILTAKSQLCLLRGEYEQARALLQENIDTQEETGNRMGYLWALSRLAQIALREGNVAEAHQILVDVIENFNADKNKNGLAFALDVLASLYVVTHKAEVAAQLIGWSDMTRKEMGDPRQRLQQDDLDRDITAITAKISASAYKAAYHTGREMSRDEVVALALDVRKQPLNSIYISDPLNKSIEYTDEDGRLSRKDVQLNHAEFFVRMQLDVKTKFVAIEHMDTSGNTTLLITEIN